jgi:hypothetical protein
VVITIKKLKQGFELGLLSAMEELEATNSISFTSMTLWTHAAMQSALVVLLYSRTDCPWLEGLPVVGGKRASRTSDSRKV